MRTISKLRTLISKLRNRFNFLVEKNLLRALEIFSKLRRESTYYFFLLTLDSDKGSDSDTDIGSDMSSDMDSDTDSDK